MAWEIRDAGTLRTITGLQIKQSGILRTIRELKVQDGGTLRTVATFATELDPSISATRTVQSVGSGGALTIIQYETLASPGGGLGPYTYSWAILSGDDWSISTATSASPRITGSSNTSTEGVARVTITDSLGQTGTADLALTV